MPPEKDRAQGADLGGGEGLEKVVDGLKPIIFPPEFQELFNAPPGDDPDLMVFAMNYVDLGIPIFPCNQAKKPLTPHGFFDATLNPDQIEAWWHKWPNALIATPTGKPSGSYVVDVDKKNGVNGFETLAALEAEHGPLPETLTAETPSGGRHFYFRFPDTEPPLGNTVGKIGPGIDTRGEGGYVIVPPSIIDGRAYRWLV
jgi:hypothetical protein